MFLTTGRRQNISERCCMKLANPSSSPRRQLQLSPFTDVESEDQRGHITGHWWGHEWPLDLPGRDMSATGGMATLIHRHRSPLRNEWMNCPTCYPVAQGSRKEGRYFSLPRSSSSSTKDSAHIKRRNENPHKESQHQCESSQPALSIYAYQARSLGFTFNPRNSPF